nr:reverse transcriptase domain-containing protein [Tanacetum cinerariifolium]
MHTRASISKLFEPLPEHECTPNRRIRRRNRRVPYDQRNNPPQHSRIVCPSILDVNYFRHFLDILRNYDPMDDEPMWAADRVIAPTPGFAITILETANEFAIKGSNKTDNDKIMARMDAMTIKMDAQYKELQARAKQPTPDLNDDDMPMSREEEAKFMQNFPGMPNYGKLLKELIGNNHKIEQISAAFLSDESSMMIQNKVPPKLGDPESFLIPCNFNKTFSYNALADLGSNINLMPYSLYAKLSLKTLKHTKMSVRLADISFQYPVGIVENMLIEVGKFTFPANFVILKIEKDNKVPLILGRPILHTADAVIRVKQKQLNLRVGTERMIFNIDSAMNHSYSNDDTCFSIDVINEILEEYFDTLLEEGSKILHSIKGTLLEKEIFFEFCHTPKRAKSETRVRGRDVIIYITQYTKKDL